MQRWIFFVILIYLHVRALFLRGEQPEGAWVLLQYAANILGYVTAKNEGKGEKCALSAGRWKAPRDKEKQDLSYGKVDFTFWQLLWPSRSPNSTAPDFFPIGVPECKMYVVRPGCNQELKIRHSIGDPNKWWCFLAVDYVAFCMITKIYRVSWGSFGTRNLQQVRNGFYTSIITSVSLKCCAPFIVQSLTAVYKIPLLPRARPSHKPCKLIF